MTAVVTEPPTRSPVACDHCGLPVPAGLVDSDAERQFCCAGCRVVYDTIHANGLDQYYRLREAVAAPSAKAAATGGAYGAYDDEAFLNQNSWGVAGGLRAVDFRLEGVHCAACLWLVERLPEVAPGVASARLTLRDAIVRVVWDPAATSLSCVARALDRLGYPPHPARGVSASDVRRRDERNQLLRLGVAGALAGNAMLAAVALYAGKWTGIEHEFAALFRWISTGLGLASLAWPGRVFFQGARAALVTRTPNLDLPIALALAVGGVAGLVNTALGRGEVYFDSLSVLVFLLLVGRWFQARQQRWADDAVGLMRAFTPATCRVVRDGRVVEAPVEALTASDTVEVRSGDLAPADGVVVSGESTINAALLTGESRAEAVAPGAPVFAGTQNVGGTLRLRVDTVGEQTRVGRLMRLVDEGVREKPPIVQLTDRAAGWFVAVIATVAVVVFTAWATLADVPTAVDHTVALLIVACPCALGLATPLTMAMAIGYAARRNILIKNAAALEKLARAGRLLLDKTGTLTEGRPVVIDWAGPEWLQAVVAEAERNSSHPVAEALAKAFASAGVAPPVRNVEEHGDGGVRATVRGGELLIGAPRFALAHGATPDARLDRLAQEHEAAGRTVVLVAHRRRIVALAAMEDAPRRDAAEAVRRLAEHRWQATILSGDARGVVRRVAQAVGVPADRALACVSPEEKLALVQLGSGSDVTVMAGDGVNDAAALAAADVGVAVQGGAEASLAAADVYLADEGLLPLVDLVQLARRTMSVVRRNLAVSLAYNATAVALAAAGLITPLLAAVLMPISSATVLGVAIAGLRKD